MSATSARVARGSAKVTSAPAAFLTCTEYFGAALGVGASLDLRLSGASGGASTGFTTEVSAAISITVCQICVNVGFSDQNKTANLKVGV
jgi:hypothetical protein